MPFLLYKYIFNRFLTTVLGIDGNASNVSVIIDIKRLSIKVIDNGEGILPQDLENIAKPRYTSKWNSDEPASTFGYKGIALSSISALSVLMISSRHCSYASTKSVRISFGSRSPVYSSNTPKPSQGTTIQITGLFSQIPVRQKHILSMSYSAQIDTIKQAIVPIAVSRPEVTISVHDSENKSILYIPSCILSTIPRDISILRAIHGLHIVDRWQTLHTKVREVDVRGTIGFDPVRNKQAQHIVINSYRLSDSALYRELNTILSALSRERHKNQTTSYMTYIFEVTYPISIDENAMNPISSEISTEKLEFISKLLIIITKKFINAHGFTMIAKTKNRRTGAHKAKIAKLSSFHKLPHTGVKHAFISHENEVENADIENKENESVSNKELISTSNRNDEPFTEKLPQRLSLMPGSKLILNRATKIEPPISKSTWGGSISKYFSKAGPESSLERKFSKSDLESMKLISQVDSKFLLVTIHSQNKEKYLAIVDQHAADERIKLEKYFSDINSKSLQKTATPLAYPMKLILTDQEFSFFKESSHLFRQFGIFYYLGSFRKSEKPFLVLTHIPELGFRKVSQSTGQIDKEFAQKLLLGHAKDIMEKRSSSLPINHALHWSVTIRNYPVAIIELFQSKACRSAIKFGDSLSPEGCYVLLQSLSKCMFPFQCAHGRPSVVPLLDLS